MLCAKNLEPTNDKLHAEEREPELDLFDTVIEDGQFLFETQYVTIVIKYTSHNVAVLNDSNQLHHEVTRSSVNNALKERLVVVERESKLELGLEACPNTVVFKFVRTR